MRCVNGPGIVVGLLFFLGCTTDAWATRVSYGRSETIRPIEPTKDPQYILCYKFSTYTLGMGCLITDDGYVLQRAGESQQYIPLDPVMIQKLQQEGTLPNPLPRYSLSIIDYLLGYSLWILLGVIFGPLLVKGAWAKLRGTTASATALDPKTA